MKRLAAVCLLLLTSAVPAQEKILGPAPPSTTFYPLKVGAKWAYATDQPQREMFVVVERLEPIKRKAREGGKSDFFDSFHIKVISQEGGAVDLTGTKGRDRLAINKVLSEQCVVTDDGVYRIASAGKEIGKDMLQPIRIFKIPPQAKDSWTFDSISEGVPIKGSFQTEMISVLLDQPRNVCVVSSRDCVAGTHRVDIDYWFADGLGIVKQRVKYGSLARTTELMIHLKEYRPSSTQPTIVMPSAEEMRKRLPVPGSAPSPSVGVPPPVIAPPPVGLPPVVTPPKLPVPK